MLFIAPKIQFKYTSSGADESISPANLELSLSATSNQAASVSYTVSGGTATGDGVDYTLLGTGTATINAGSTKANISIAIIDDSLDEPNETIEVTISNPTNATLGANTVHTFTILDNDPTPTVSFTGAPYTIGEGAGIQTVTVTLTGQSAQTVTVNYYISDGTATAGEDYTATDSILTWNPGETGDRTFSVQILDDSLYEGNETINVKLLNFVNCEISGSNDATIYIEDDDPQPPTLISPSEGAVLDNGCTTAADQIEWDFDWSDVSGATKYHLYVKWSNATIPVIDNEEITTSSYHYSSSGYIADANRFDRRWKVRAYVGGTWSAWSEERSFDVEPLNTDCPSENLIFVVQPSNTVVNQPISPAVEVRFLDDDGNPLPGLTVNMEIGYNAGGATQFTWSAITDASGIARFAFLVIDKAGTGYTLKATVTIQGYGTWTAYSIPFNVI